MRQSDLMSDGDRGRAVNDCQGYGRLQASAGTGGRTYLKCPADRLQPFFHADQSEALSPARLFEIKASALI